MEGKRKPHPKPYFPNQGTGEARGTPPTHILLRADQPQEHWGSLQCTPVGGEERRVLRPRGPRREGELLTIVISVVRVGIAGAAASSGLLGGGASRWVGPGVCQPRVGSRAEAPGRPGGEHVDAGVESPGRPGK